MKKIFLISVIFFGLLHALVIAQTGWFIIPGISTDNLYEIEYHSFTASDWVVGANGTLLKTPDHGVTWDTLYTGISIDLKGRSGPASYQDWIAGSSGTVLISVDLGVTWISRQPNTTVNFNTIFSRGSGTAYVAGNNGAVFYSSDMGVTWANRPAPTNEQLNCGIGPTSGTTLHALVGGNNGIIFKSTDAGVSWTSTNSGTNNNINNFGFGPGSIVFAVGDSGTILKSVDAGDSWSSVSTPTAENLFSIDPSGQNANWLTACGDNGTLLKSTDGGTNWILQYSPTTEHLYSILTVTNNTHLAVGANGIILKTTDGGGGQVSIDDNHFSAIQFSLAQNYPNPFNPVTVINYRLASKSEIQLIIYDIIGREIKTLVNQVQNSGEHSINFDASGFASGIYIYKLKTNSFEQSRKMLLLR